MIAMAFGERPQPREQMLADAQRVLLQPFVAHDVEHRDARPRTTPCCRRTC